MPWWGWAAVWLIIQGGVLVMWHLAHLWSRRNSWET